MQQEYHPGKTCSDLADQLFEKYKHDNNVRKCVDCKAPTERYAGCYKVRCTRCGAIMCFKCPPNSMRSYRTESECYTHLRQAHGGFF